MNPTIEVPEEVEQDYDELLESLQEALEWAKGERELPTIVRAINDEFYSEEAKESTQSSHTPATKQHTKVISDI